MTLTRRGAVRGSAALAITRAGWAEAPRQPAVCPGTVGDILGQTDLRASCAAIVDAWAARLGGAALSESARLDLVGFLAADGDPNAPPAPMRGAPDWGDQGAVAVRVRAVVQLLATNIPPR